MRDTLATQSGNYEFLGFNKYPPKKDAPLVSETLLYVIKSMFYLEKTKRDVKRVDGLIIGTGEADFTKGNTTYTLYIEDKAFQLLDVPGIEGNESIYAHYVKEAIAKAHMVVYVNGTNKKPEVSTAEKIKSYLQYGTTVYPVVNVRGFADSYEFEEDREDLTMQGGAGNALQQTVDVLTPILGEDVLRSGDCVQGLLAFSSLAYDKDSQSTTIHSSRNHNLAAQQKSYLKFFSSNCEMQDFSRINVVADAVREKVSTFKEDIVESNKGKVLESLNHYLTVLDNQLENHNTFLKKTEPEFEKCRVAFDNAIKEFERHFENKRRNRWNKFFNDLMDNSDNIVEQYYGDNSSIERLINKKFDRKINSVEEMMLQDNEESVSRLRKNMLDAFERLLQDIKQVDIQQDLKSKTDASFYSLGHLDLGPRFSLGDIGSILFKIGSYVAGGATVGSSFPVIGTAIGAAVGALVGVVMTVVGIFSSKATKIRKAQAKVRNKLEGTRQTVLRRIKDETKVMVTSINSELKNSLMIRVNDMESELKQPLIIFEEQITAIKELKNKIESMPYGTIRAV
ncbi:DUF1269 domain-containing protein [Vibrio sp. EJY3]|uniref:DUF1269 domain-containing protein n=1 Tax=Vibrio sp. (strain EJY3) TaxID=1116375 RepID=UPI000243BA2B|nr:DUF1269 domain-containing protein [Vibrio sp. EJY3]AEX23573.1 hypothetical protein VEJY3_05265 [Vibrio sp. EJY3]